MFSCNTKIFIELKKFENIQQPRMEKHTFSRTIQEQKKIKNIQGFQGPVTTVVLQLSNPMIICSFFSFPTFVDFFSYFVFQFCNCYFQFTRNIFPLQNNFSLLLTKKNIFFSTTKFCKYSSIRFLYYFCF